MTRGAPMPLGLSLALVLCPLQAFAHARPHVALYHSIPSISFHEPTIASLARMSQLRE